MNPAFLDNMSWEMAEVYGAITDQILINLARHFPFYHYVDDVPTSAFAYQASMLAQMGQVSAETVQIIRNSLQDADLALHGVLEQAIIDAVKSSEPELLEATKKGVFQFATLPAVVAPEQMKAFQLYYTQAADKLNLVNTVMLESTRSAYQQTVSDVVSWVQTAERINATQTALDIATGEVVTGVSSWNTAIRHATDRMKANGITGFIDHAGHRWGAEGYVAMDIRTTVFNTGRAAVWEMNQDFGNDLYLVSYHNGARPLCYDWQNKVISSTDNARTVYDLDGNEIHVYRQSDTSYGQAAGLFGINCKHYPSPFIPGVSTIKGQPQDKEANDKTYAESQQQRSLERKIREEKRDLQMMKAQGASAEEIAAQREKIKQTSSDIDTFCNETGRHRHRDRESVYTQREFPDADRYDVTKFENEQKKLIEDYYRNGGEQQGYTFGQMTTNEPITPATTPLVVPATTPVVPTTPTTTVEKTDVEKRCESRKIERVSFNKYTTQPTETEIIDRISGADKTKGSCASIGLAYAGNKCGYEVNDFRGGSSQFTFSQVNNLLDIGKLDGVVSFEVRGYNDFTNAHNLLKNVEDGKEYFFTCGKHAAIVRKSATGYEYLEMQSGYRKNTWYSLTDSELKRRFGAQRSHTTYGMKYEVPEVMIDINTLKGNKQFENILEFINTAAGKEMKGIGGGEK